MSTKLEDYLRRKRTTLQNFVLAPHIQSYQDLIDYCARRGCEPITEEKYNLLLSALQSQDDKPKIVKKAEVVNEKESSVKTKPRRKRKSTVSRSAQKVQKTRSADKPVENA